LPSATRTRKIVFLWKSCSDFSCCTHETEEKLLG
jgi:hypothetical protein